MKAFTGKKILIFQQRGWGITIGHVLAQKLQEEGARLAALTLKKDTHEFVAGQTQVHYEHIDNNDAIMEDPHRYLSGDTYSLVEICAALGVDTIWPLVMSLRNHVRSYGDKYYYGFKQNVPDEEIIAYVMAFYKYIRHIFAEFKPDVIIAPNFVALPHIMLNLYAKQNGIKMLAVTDCKVRGMYIFTYSYQDDEGGFFDRLRELASGQAQSRHIDRAKQYIREFREQFKNPLDLEKIQKKPSWKTILRKELAPYVKIVQWYLRRHTNKVTNVGISIDFRPPRIILRDHFTHKRYTRHINNRTYYPYEQVGRYVYFPLQFQPEASIDVASPFFSNQIETARQVAMSLPGDYTLVVKEHPAMVGYRPPSYLEKIARTINVKLVDYRIPSETVIKGADLIISPNSTTIAEAAYLRKPVIQLGDLGTTLALPNVFQHKNISTLAKKIKEVLSINLQTEAYERKLEQYVAAAFDTGFDLDYNEVWERGAGVEKLWQIYKAELLRNL